MMLRILQSFLEKLSILRNRSFLWFYDFAYLIVSYMCSAGMYLDSFPLNALCNCRDASVEISSCTFISFTFGSCLLPQEVWVKKIMLSCTRISCTIRVKHLFIVEESGMLSKIVRIGYAAYRHYYKHTHSRFSLVYLPLLDFIWCCGYCGDSYKSSVYYGTGASFDSMILLIW
jgi:hypothetical protein